MIIIHAELKINPEQRSAFLEQARAAVAETRKEEGNISYSYYESVEEPNTFMFVEQWKDKPAVDFHSGSAHFLAFIGAIRPMLTAPFQPQVFLVPDPQQ
ncbi:quinol monooxygenase YgiN [Paenibacillus phyllosphaerae]|uniref:Quinol monooxygenase YgiN n=1 Tax=Paenibacillus phyllosphaerae TaxID=274593 RepID=A0A7W5FNK4_9BACL|nr:putative quinol monooxygenase [Paenibacillus phyllosphaerae]MBB3111237.1 quinol monooxygenase YgiN [Paenibacillus phyllosphaerae]